MSLLVGAFEAVVVLGFIVTLAVREVMRSYGTPRTINIVRTLTRLAVVIGVVFVVIIARRFYELAT